MTGRKEPQNLSGPLWRAASGRLWLHLESDPADDRLDELDVVKTLEQSLAAVFDRSAWSSTRSRKIGSCPSRSGESA